MGGAFQCHASILPYVQSFFFFFFGFCASLTNCYIVWTGLEGLGFGANLQHYSPLIDAGVATEWDLPSDWRLVAQLVFGSPEAAPAEKVQKPVEERVKVFGKL